MTRFGISLLGSLLFVATAAGAVPQQDPSVLSVCADPSNLPYSNQAQEGFENKIAAVLAEDLHATLRYVWSEQRRSFFRRTLLAGRCDMVISAPTMLPIIAVTRPFFTSSYVAVTRSSDTLHFTSFDQPEWQTARIGLQLLGAEGVNTPPAMALSRRGLNRHIAEFPMWDEDDNVKPQGKIIDAVASGEIDVAMVWGPFAGYFAKPYGAALRLEPIVKDDGNPGLVFSYPMALGVRKDDTARRDQLQAALDRHKTEIDAILRDYGVPLITQPAAGPVTDLAAFPIAKP
jgi:quinoprotein dehydrogenase-associated probable ABC transporter substrate-binding protein